MNDFNPKPLVETEIDCSHCGKKGVAASRPGKTVSLKETESVRKRSTLLSLAAVWLTLALGAQAQAQSGSWETKAPMSTCRFWTATGVVAGRLYVATGTLGYPPYVVPTVDVYDPATNIWTTVAPIPTSRTGASAGELRGELFVVGGTEEKDGSVPTNTLEAYNPLTNTWATKVPMPTARSRAAAGVLAGKLYVAGGVGTYYDVDMLEVYDPATGVWTTKASIPTARHLAGGTVINGKLYVVGGTQSSGLPGDASYLSTLEVYDPATDTWTTKTPMPTPRYAVEVGEVNGILYAVGGVYPGVGPDPNYPEVVEAYNPTTNTWITVSPIPIGHYGSQPQTINGVLYVTGGAFTVLDCTMLEAFTPDTTPPVIGPVTNLTAAATSPSGAVVSFALPTATDAVDPAPVVTASPASGSTFPVGTTTVTVTARDFAGNTSTKTFTVTVLGPSQMTSNLIATVTSLNFQQGIRLLQNALRQINPGNTSIACSGLSAFINQVQAQSGKQLTVATTTQLIASAVQIKAALGCP